jgi:phosphoglycolate phosphatase
MNRAVLLDLDGTLVDSRSDLAASANAGRSAIGLPPLPVDVVGSFVGDGAAKLIERSTPEADPAARVRALAVFREHYRRQCTVATRAYPGIPEALEHLASDGWRLAVVTNKPAEYSRSILAACGLDRHIAHLHGGDTLRKPDPAAIHAALTPLGADAAGSWMVGDHHTDLVSGRAAGCRTCFCTWGFGRRDGHHADGTADQPSDLPRVLVR